MKYSNLTGINNLYLIIVLALSGTSLYAMLHENLEHSLITACKFGNNSIVEYILTLKDHDLQSPLNINCIDKEGQRPLSIASSLGYEKIVEMLLENGANPDIADTDSYAPLHFASLNQNKEIVALLLKQNANPDIMTQYQYTPLHFAACNGNIDIVRLLLEYGANRLLATPYGETALDFAMDDNHNTHNEIVKILDPNVEFSPSLTAHCFIRISYKG